MIDYNKAFTKNVTSLLIENNMTMKKLANEIRISPGALSYNLNRKTDPSVYTVISIALYFGVSVDYLLGLAQKDGTRWY